MQSALGLPPIAAFLALTAAIPQAHAADTYTSADEKAIAAAAAPSPWSATITAANGYVARGIRQSWGRLALQGGIDYGRGDGWFAGARASSIDKRFVENGWLELDVYGGYRRAIGQLGYSAAVAYYKYPGARSSATGTGMDYGELQTALQWKWLYAKYNVTFTPSFFGMPDARGSGYLDLGAKHEFANAFTVALHAGDGRVAGAGNGAYDWRDLSAGLSRRLHDRWEVALNYSRAAGATGVFDRYASGNARIEQRPFATVRRALVLSLSRKF